MPDSFAARLPARAASTNSVHAGEARFRAHHSLTVPIVQTSVYTFESCEALANYAEEHMFWDEAEREEYGRYGNPTVRAAEAKLAALEGAEDAMLVSSGMGAVASTLLLLLRAGDHVILTDECYYSTLLLGRNFLPRYGIEVSIVRHGDYAALEAAIQPNSKLICAETPTNPFMHLLDLPRLVAIARRHNLKTVIDSTFATPLNLRPLEHGVDIVIHSVTKYLAGHNDLMAGAVITNFKEMTPLRQAQSLLGNIVDPHAAYLILRGSKTLALRVAQQNANGLAVAQFLADQAKIRKVWYPGLDSHRDHRLAVAQMKGFGGVVSFELEGGDPDDCRERAYRLINHLKIPTIGPSLGGVETMVSPLAVMGYAMLEPEARLALGIRDELVRYCCGIEDTEDLIADLRQALEAV